MAYLTIGAITVPVTRPSGEEVPEIIGSRERAVDGTMTEDRVAVKRKWTAETPPIPAADGATLVAALIAATPASPLACTGDLTGTASCIAEISKVSKMTIGGNGVRRWVVAFDLLEV